MTSKRSPAERTELSDGRMLMAAKQLIIQRGTHKTSLKEVGERAGYSRGLASSRFGSKENLFRHITALYEQKWRQYVSEFTAGKKGVDALLARIDAVEAILNNEPEEVRAVYTIWFESVSDHSSLHKQLQEYNSHGRDRLVQVIREGIDSGDISSDIDADSCTIAYLSHMFGLIYQWLVSPEDIDLGKSLENLKGYCTFVLKPANQVGR